MILQTSKFLKYCKYVSVLEVCKDTVIFFIVIQPFSWLIILLGVYSFTSPLGCLSEQDKNVIDISSLRCLDVHELTKLHGDYLQIASWTWVWLQS